MKTFFVLGDATEGSQDLGADDVIIICDRFSWLAAIAPSLWFLWRGMWIHALLTFVFGLFMAFAIPFEQASDTASILAIIAAVAIAIWFGLEARYFHIEHLKRQGFQVLDMIIALDGEMAMDLYQQSRSARADTQPMQTIQKPVSGVSAQTSQSNDFIFGRT